jgi:uncharacterized membrane protein
MNIFYAHAAAMAAGFLLIAAGFVVVRFYRQNRAWLKIHKTVGIIGSLFFLMGLTAAVAMVSQSGEGHVKVPHAWLGMATFFVAVTTPILGQLQFKIRARIQQLRIMHRWFGRLTLVMVLLTLLSGLRTAGVI